MKKVCPTLHRSCHGHFHERVKIDMDGGTARKRKARLVQYSEEQNNRCAYCGTNVVFWWEFDDLVTRWNTGDSKTEQNFQSALNKMTNLAVFDYYDQLAARTRHNTFVACQECHYYRTKGTGLHSNGIPPTRFYEVRRDPERWATMVKWANFHRKKKAKKKVIENLFREGLGQTLNKSMFANIETFLAIDIEWYERDDRKILEVGLTRFTADRIVPKHIIIREYLDVVNQKYVPNKKDHFHHGQSETVLKVEAADIVRAELSKVEGVVVHGGEQDLTALKHIGVDVDRDTTVYDTQKMFSMMLGVRDRYKLGLVSEFMDHDLQDPHNAGNDAFATAKSFIEMRAIIEAEQKLSYTGRMLSGNLRLETVEISAQES